MSPKIPTELQAVPRPAKAGNAPTALLAGSANQNLGNQNGCRNEKDAEQIHQHKRPATVLAGDVGEFPNVAESN